MGSAPQPHPEKPYRGLGRLVIGFLVVNLLVFLGYRLLFLAAYVDGASTGQEFEVLLFGARIDLALLGAELAALVLLSLFRLRIRLRSAFALCFGLTALNTLLCVADFVFYGERDEHLGRLLMANLTSPDVLGDELSRFARVNPWAVVGVLAALVGFVVLAVWFVRRVPQRSWSHVRPKRRLFYAFLFVLFFMLPIYQPVRVVGGERIVEGWSVDVANPEHYQVFDDYVLHQALPNPLHDLLFGRLPQLLAAPPPSRFPPEEASTLLRQLVPGDAVDARYPLLRHVDDASDLGIENVLIVQVEGLSGSLVAKDEDGKPVMPFLRDLASRSLYFPNTLHGYPTTYGGLYCMTSSLARTATKVVGGRFTYDEREGYFGSAARCLPELATREFLHGGLQTADDIRTFMGNQGFHTVDWVALGKTLEGQVAEAELRGDLGIWDGPFLQEVARVFRAAPEPAWIHALTASTHSPWKVPPSAPVVFDDQVLAGFRYLDDQFRAFFAALEAEPERMAKTLVVLTADHVSFGYGHNELDWVRIPLLFYNPTFVERGIARRNERWATHADAMRTVLALLGGTHMYAGLGRNLLEEEEPYGTLGSSKDEAYYVRDGYLLRWNYARDTVTLHTATPDGWGSTDLSRTEPERFERMSTECFALFEGVRHLLETGRVFPR